MVIMASFLIKNVGKFELERDLPKGTWKSFRIMETFELRKGNYKSFLRKFHGDFKFVWIIEIFEPWRFGLVRANCKSMLQLSFY